MLKSCKYRRSLFYLIDIFSCYNIDVCSDSACGHSSKKKKKMVPFAQTHNNYDVMLNQTPKSKTNLLSRKAMRLALC